MKVGNSMSNRGRKVNGDVTDYMYNKNGVLAVTPQIGSSNIFSNVFYITDPNILQDVVA